MTYPPFRMAWDFPRCGILAPTQIHYSQTSGSK